MAVRKVYLSLAEFPYAKEVPVTFPWSNGSKHQNIQAVLDTFHDVYPEIPVLEVSLASAQPEGVGVAAMKLPLRLADGKELPVGVVYQGSKVFENGGPYTDLWQLSHQKVQKDPRLHQSGRCIGYRLEGMDYPAEPHPYAFFNWLYCRALAQDPDRGQELLRYGAFSDLDLGSAKTDRNSPARAAAVYGGLKAAGRLDCLASYEAFVAVTCEGAEPVSPEPEAATPLPEPQETPEPSGMAPVDETPVIDRADDTQESSMEEVLALPDGMRVSYLGEEVCDAYPHDGEEHYFMLTATSGKKLLVLSFQLTNETEQEQSVDIASQNVEFRITVNEDYKRRAMPSLLLDDLSTYVDVIPAGETRTAVLVIEVEQQSDEEITSLSLKLKNDTKIYTIQLK